VKFTAFGRETESRAIDLEFVRFFRNKAMAESVKLVEVKKEAEEIKEKPKKTRKPRQSTEEKKKEKNGEASSLPTPVEEKSQEKSRKRKNAPRVSPAEVAAAKKAQSVAAAPPPPPPEEPSLRNLTVNRWKRKVNAKRSAFARDPTRNNGLIYVNGWQEALKKARERLTSQGKHCSRPKKGTEFGDLALKIFQEEVKPGLKKTTKKTETSS